MVIASDLVDKVVHKAGIENYQTIGEPCPGAAFCSTTYSTMSSSCITYRHPFINRTSPVVTADYVTLEDGTGLVHTAPGHGQEDYQTGIRYCIHMKTNFQGVQIVSANFFQIYCSRLKKMNHLSIVQLEQMAPSTTPLPIGYMAKMFGRATAWSLSISTTRVTCSIRKPSITRTPMIGDPRHR